jgi:hypothetical protein
LNLNIHQIYFQENQKEKLLTGSLPYFNKSDNTRQLFETEVILALFLKETKLIADEIYGVLSWRFTDKTKLSLEGIKSFVDANPSKDVFLMNPFPELTYVYDNPWIQGEFVHPGLLDLAQKIFDLSPYNVSLRSIHLASNRQVYCNYFLAKGSFWIEYIQFLNTLVETIEKNSKVNQAIKKQTSYNYEASFLPFFLERLLPTYLFLNPSIETVSYPYSDSFLLNRYLEVIKDKENTLLRHQRVFRKIPFLSLIKKLIHY